jgi:Protein kinase domain
LRVPLELIRIYDLAMSLEAGQVFAGYTILRTLGAGAMGTVYLAAHPRLPRQDALKVLPADLTGDAEFRARFLREAELAASLSHPHIVRIHDRGEFDGQFWISMDFVAGTDASRLLLENYPRGMPLTEVVPIITGVASALDYAHHRGLLHRDVKPANILLADPDGQQRRVFLADFGVARRMDDALGLTATNMTVGTVAYAAPEQLKGEPMDGRADQYALACTAYHLLTGAPPYDYSNPAVVISQHVAAPPPAIGQHRPDLAGLDAVFATAMAKEPGGRFGTCGEFAHQLMGVGVVSAYTQDTQPAIGVTMPALPLLGTAPTRKGLARQPRVLIPALLGVLLLVAGGIFAAVKLTQHPHPATSAAHPTAGAPKPPPNTGPFTGVYRAQFGDGTNLDDVPAPGAPPSTDTYAVRSACGSAGCVATASHLGGETTFAPTMVFDQLGGDWLAVALGSDTCRDAPSEVWETFTLQAGPDATFTGAYTANAANSCGGKHTVTFTRTGDVDVNSLPDPATLPPRVVSPAEALRGRYREKRTFSVRAPQQQTDFSVTTECLRTGDRCLSYFHAPSAAVEPLVFGGGNWVLDTSIVSQCRNAPVTTKKTAQFPLPQPPPDPISLLTGHGKQVQTGSCPASVDFDATFTRTGD